jgi:Domain of unknown function (DUF6458)
MGIGASVFLLAVGAIITFAFNLRVGWLDLDVVGWVLMAAGAVGLLVTLIVVSQRRRTVITNETVAPPPVAPPVTRPGEHIVDEYGRRY